MTKRRHISARERLQIFASERGICHLCNGRINAAIEAYDISHDTPLELGGADDGPNLKVAHRKCHKDRTAADVEAISRAKRQEARHLGAAQPKQKIPSRPKSGPKRAPRPLPPRRPMYVPCDDVFDLLDDREHNAMPTARP